MYWMEDVGEQQAIRSKSPWGQIRPLATGAFGPARWLTATPEGLGYFLKGDVLHRVSADGQLKLVTGHLSRKPAPNYALMGLWTDGAGRVYVANTHDNIVQRVASRGAVSTVAKGSAGWTASGGTVAPNGDLWLLEYSAANAVRVRCITGGGK